jgi:hypothetical protein
MPYETIWEQKGVYQRFSGQVTSEDREQANNAVMGNPRFDGLKYWIVDSLAIEEYLLDKRDAVLAAGFDLGAEYINNTVLMVFIATNTDHRDNIQLYMKFLKDLGCAWETRLFDDVGPARQWISETLRR